MTQKVGTLSLPPPSHSPHPRPHPHLPLTPREGAMLKGWENDRPRLGRDTDTPHLTQVPPLFEPGQGPGSWLLTAAVQDSG